MEFPIGQLHEDVGTIYKLFAKAKSVVCGYECLNYYMQRDNSIIHSAFNPDRFDYITHTINIIQYMEENFPELINAAVFMHFRACIQLYLSIPKTVEYKPYRKKIEHEINKYRRLVLDDQEARVSFRIIAAVTYLGHGWLYLLTPFK